MVESPGLRVRASSGRLVDRLETALLQALLEDLLAELVQHLRMMRQFTSAADVAGAVIYFVSELGSFITGEVIEINGGLYFA